MAKEIEDTDNETILKSEHEKLVSKISKAYEKEKESLRAELDTLKSTHKSVNDEFTTKSAELTKLTKDIESLRESHEAAKGQLTKYQEWEKSYLESKVSSLSEDFRDLVPENLSALDKIAFIDKLSGKIGNQKKQDVGSVNGTNKPPTDTEIDFSRLTKDRKYYEEIREKAMKDPELWKKLSKGPNA